MGKLKIEVIPFTSFKEKIKIVKENIKNKVLICDNFVIVEYK